MSATQMFVTASEIRERLAALFVAIAEVERVDRLRCKTSVSSMYCEKCQLLGRVLRRLNDEESELEAALETLED